MVPSTTAELLATSKALLIKDIPPQPVVILTDSRCATRVIGNPHENIIAQAARNVIKVLVDKGLPSFLNGYHPTSESLAMKV